MRLNKVLLEQMMSGSYEGLISSVCEAVKEYSKGGQNLRAVATYDGYALALSEDGKFYRLPYLRESGKVMIKGKEEVPELTVKEDLYVKDVAKKIRDDLFAGSGLNVVEMLDLAKAYDVLDDETKLVESLDRERVWRREFKKNESQIRTRIQVEDDDSTGEDDEPLDTDASKIKTSDSVPKQPAPPSLIVTDMKRLHEKVKKILDSILEIYDLYSKQKTESVEDKDVVKYARTVMSDIEEDMKGVLTKISGLSECKATTYRLLKNYLQEAEIFVRFIGA